MYKTGTNTGVGDVNKKLHKKCMFKTKFLITAQRKHCKTALNKQTAHHLYFNAS